MMVTTTCRRCGRTPVNAQSQFYGLGPVCLEAGRLEARDAHERVISLERSISSMEGTHVLTDALAENHRAACAAQGGIVWTESS